MFRSISVVHCVRNHNANYSWRSVVWQLHFGGAVFGFCTIASSNIDNMNTHFLGLSWESKTLHMYQHPGGLNTEPPSDADSNLKCDSWIPIQIICKSVLRCIYFNSNYKWNNKKALHKTIIQYAIYLSVELQGFAVFPGVCCSLILYYITYRIWSNRKCSLSAHKWTLAYTTKKETGSCID